MKTHYVFRDACDMFAIAFLDLIVIHGFYNIFLTLGPAKPIDEEASTRFPQLYLQMLFRRWHRLFVRPRWPAGISKSNCQNKPKFTGFMWGSQLRRRGFIHIPGWHSAIFYSPNVSSLEFPKISSSSNYWLDLSWNQLFQYAELFMKALTEHCSLPSDCTETTIW